MAVYHGKLLDGQYLILILVLNVFLQMLYFFLKSGPSIEPFGMTFLLRYFKRFRTERKAYCNLFPRCELITLSFFNIIIIINGVYVQTCYDEHNRMIKRDLKRFL